ncbi:MAG: hypothetical protein M3336_15135 [Chloroflexota bacterium]|nr:hypothetical protein [Chloroflexota bacterium]
MATPVGQAAVDEHALSVRERRCVLFVHGIGEQRKSETLLWMGSPLVDWVLKWSRAFYGPGRAAVGRVELSFTPFDQGMLDKPPIAILNLPDQQWYLGEAWWAGSNYHPDFATMLSWSLAHLGDILAQLIRAAFERARYLFAPKPNSSAPGWLWRAIDLLNCIGLCVLYALGAVIGYPLIVLLMILSQIPIEAVQDFVLFRLLQPFLSASVGDFKLFLDDELQAANVRRRVADAARDLLDRVGCRDLVVVAHSEGAVASLGVLTDPEFRPLADSVKLITLGAGLNKSWLVRPDLDRIFAPVTDRIAWTDIWASYDPVPAGPLDPSPRQGVTIADIFRPGGVPSTPVSEQVTNGMEVLTDHGAYFDNDEQVLLRLAAEISAPDHRQSVFWPRGSGPDPEAFLHQWVRKRRVRVSALALWRDIAVAAWLALAVVAWLPVPGWLTGVDPWAPLEQVAPTAPLVGGFVAGLRGLHAFLSGLPALFAPVAAAVGAVLQVPAGLGLAALAGLLCLLVYRLVVWAAWSRWDARERAAFVDALAAYSRQRLRLPAAA